MIMMGLLTLPALAASERNAVHDGGDHVLKPVPARFGLPHDLADGRLIARASSPFERTSEAGDGRRDELIGAAEQVLLQAPRPKTAPLGILAEFRIAAPVQGPPPADHVKF